MGFFIEIFFKYSPSLPKEVRLEYSLTVSSLHSIGCVGVRAVPVVMTPHSLYN